MVVDCCEDRVMSFVAVSRPAMLVEAEKLQTFACV